MEAIRSGARQVMSPLGPDRLNPEADLTPAVVHPYPPAPARRLASVQDSVIPQLGALLRQRPDALSLAQGMVNWAPPAAVREALVEALRSEPNQASLDRYGAVQGDPALQQAVHRELGQHQGLDLEDSALLVTAGSNMAFNAIAQVILDPGDEVILPLPWYFNHVMAIQLAGGRPIGVDAGAVPDPARLAAAITPRTRAIVTTSPGNPSGVVIPGPVLAAINRICADHGLFHVSDEAYAAFVHGDVPHVPPGRLTGSGAHTVSLHSLSKAYGMAGWRVGYAAVPKRLLSGLIQVQDTVLICPPRPMQLAARAALAAGPDWIAPRVAELGQRRRQLLDALEDARQRGLPIAFSPVPDGAFYLLLRCATRLNGHELVQRLLLEHGVATLPGEGFGLAAASGWASLRLSYAMLEASGLALAVARLLRGLKDLCR